MRIRFTMAFLAAWCLSAVSMAATPKIDVGTILLQPNKSNQMVQVFVTGGDAVSTFNLRAQIGDGVNPSPIFQSVSFTGGMWDAYANTVTGEVPAGYEQYAQYSVALNAANQTVPASGLLATLIIDTTGFTTDAYYPLKLSGADLIKDDSNFATAGGADLAADITNGLIHVVVPEPGSLSLLAVAVLVLGRRRR